MNSNPNSNIYILSIETKAVKTQPISFKKTDNDYSFKNNIFKNSKFTIKIIKQILELIKMIESMVLLLCLKIIKRLKKSLKLYETLY